MLVAAQVSEPATTTVYGLTPRRLWATLAAVLAPLAFTGGLTGSLFTEFALTLAGSVVISGIVALTITPTMSARLLNHGTPGRFQKLVAKRIVLFDPRPQGRCHAAAGAPGQTAGRVDHRRFCISDPPVARLGIGGSPGWGGSATVSTR